MAELASLQIKVVRDGIEQAQKALNDLAKAADQAEKSTGGLNKTSVNTSKSTKTFADEIMNLGAKFTALYLAKQMADFALACIKASANMEQTRVAFTTMLGSAEKANTLLMQMQDFAASTPFEFTEVADAGKRLIAFGFSAESVIKNLRMLGDVAAGLGQPIGDMVYLFGQIKTQGKAMTQDLMQFANRGVPIYDELAKVLGVSTAKIRDLASQGKIGFAEIEKVFQNLTKEGSKFGGMMEAQAKTIAGQWSNFKDQLNKVMIIFGDSAQTDVGDFIKLLTGLLQIMEKIITAEKGNSDPQQKGLLGTLALQAQGTIDYLDKVSDKMGELEKKSYTDFIMENTGIFTDDVSASMDEILKYQGEHFGLQGEINAAADIYRMYLLGDIKLTEEQVVKLQEITKQGYLTNKAAEQYELYLKGGVKLTAEQLANYKEIYDMIKKASSVEVNYDMTNTHDRERYKQTHTTNTNNNTTNTNSGDNAAWLKMKSTTHGIFMNSLSEEDQIRNKADEQLQIIQETRKYAAANSAIWQESFAAEAAVISQRDEALQKSNSMGKSIAEGIFGNNIDQAKKAKVVFDDMIKSFATQSLYAAADGFEKIGEALGKGEMNGRAFKKIMAEMTMAIIEQLPMLFISAGLQACIAGMWPLGLSLIGIGLAGQVGVGYIKGQQAKEQAKADASASAAAHGAVYGYAAGGTFTNEIVNSPTRFTFSSGGKVGNGFMGEAGTEAVVPLKRMSNGNLGVESSGGGEVNVYVINNSGESVDVEQSTGENGTDITITVGAIVAKGILEGSFDKPMKARYGLSQRGV